MARGPGLEKLCCGVSEAKFCKQPKRVNGMVLPSSNES